MSICQRLEELPLYQHAKHIAIYHAVQNEVDLSALHHSLVASNKIYYFPVINTENSLSFLPVTSNTIFSNNKFGIPEPQIPWELALTPNALDIICLPLVAFDNMGTRLGMGGGYYDRTLATTNRPLLIGVAYECQHQTFLLRERWDVPMDMVITESNTYDFQPNKDNHS